MGGGRPPGRLPDFVIIGAAPSGTTWVARQLRLHPEIHVAPQKEVNFFEQDANFERGPDWYRAQFLRARSGQRVGEATPAYMMVPRAAERMAALIPDARLIAILRNPVDRAYSLYWFTHNWGADDRTPEQALREAMAREGPSDAPPRSYLGS